MSLKPVDIQNLYVHLHNISREQSARQEAPVHAQKVAEEEFKQKTLQADEKVSASESASAGPESVKEDENQHAEREFQDNKEEHEEITEVQVEGNTEELFRDPDLGNNIDISG